MFYKVVVTDYNYPNLEEEEGVFKGTNIEIFDANGKCRTEDDVLALTRDADAIITQFVLITRNIIKELTKCKIIVRYAIGVDNIDVAAATEYRIMVANVPEYCTEEVSLHALALMLNLLRKVTLMDREAKSGKWSYKGAVPIFRISKQIVGLIAFGKIARSFAAKALNLGLKVLVYDPYFADKDLYPSYEFVSLEELLQKSDVISVHAPLTDETRHLVNEKAFTLMKEGTFILNTSRGGIIDEEALVRALKSGKIAGAALDVLSNEKSIIGNPLLNMENVILTPHIAWYSVDSIKELQRKAAEQVRQALLVGKAENLVNFLAKEGTSNQ
jgi:D-3-phosphoglycerate dehydrogenase